MTNKTGHFGFAKVAARTDVGRKRTNNEDAFGVFHEAGVFCVADGMGGGDDGEIASAAVVNGLEDGLKALEYSPDGAYAVVDVAAVVEASLTKASAWIFNRARVKKLSGCGSTFVGFALDATAPGNALAIHAGDSRLYLLHGRSIRQITHDHSVAEMIGAKDESKINPMFRSMVMNAIGIRAKADPERTPFKVVSGDRVLVCSDGLSRMVPDKKILAISRKNDDVAAAADALIAEALEAGGIDNVTVVLVEIGELPPAQTALPPPKIECAADTAADGAERETGLTGGNTTEDGGETMATMATMAPTMAEEDMLAPEERDDATEHVGDSNRIRKRFPQALGAVAFLVLIVLAVWLCVAKKSDKAETFAERAAPVATLPTEEVATHPLEPSTTNDVGGLDIHDPTNEPPDASSDVAPAIRVTNAPLSKVEAVATNAVASPRAPEAFEEVVKTCSEESLDRFCQALRRLEGPGNQELATQMKRFVASAHFCARMRSRDGAERAIVDLRYCLISAEKTKAALAASDRIVAKKLLVWWDALLTVEASDANAMQAAVLFMNKLPEAADR